MRIVLLRHATRTKADAGNDEYLEVGQPLDARGEAEAKLQGEEIRKRGVALAACFTSCFLHARQTGEIVWNSAGSGQAKIVGLCTLTPHYQGPREWRDDWTGRRILDAIGREARARGHNLQQFEAVALVTHQPRLKQLAASMTSLEESGFANIGYCEGLCLQAKSLDQFLEGSATEECRFLFAK